MRSCEIAPFPVNWKNAEASHAWTQVTAVRAEFLSRVLSATKALFAMVLDDASHHSACCKMQRRLTGKPFRFIEYGDLKRRYVLGCTAKADKLNPFSNDKARR